MRAIRLFMFTVVAAATAGACGDNNIDDTPPAALCADGLDNDGDGLVDFPEDPGCESAEDQTEDTAARPQCDDGRDNDGDGRTDYPADPGCLAPQQDDEIDDCPSGPGCPQCANGIDDDGNGAIDYPDDPGCMAASDPTEFINNPAACGAGLIIKQLPSNGMDTGMLDATSTSNIISPCGGGNGSPGYAYQLSLTEPKVVVASTDGSATDTVLDIRGAACSDPGSHVMCNDDISSSNSGSELTVSLPAGNYFLIVEGHDSSVSGAYTLTVQLFTGEGATCTDSAQCGPGLVCRTPLGASQMVCADPACSDGVDDDGDLKIDYPLDPGCASPADNDEADDCPTGPNCPACGNEIDDDSDGQTDYPADDSCSAASGTSESCQTTEGVVAITTGSTAGTTIGATNDGSLACGLSSSSAPDLTYSLTVPTMRQLVIDNVNSFDAVVALFDSTCGGTALQCMDTPETLTLTNLAAGNYYYVVDGWSTGEGAFTINLSGTIAPGGSCEPDMTFGGALTCPAANPCIDVAGTLRCTPTACGDGVDNDGDMLTDYPADPGCSFSDDTDESDTCMAGPGPGCPECADGIDNDGDGQTDFPDDTTCAALSTPREGCVASEAVETLTLPVTMGTTVGAINDGPRSCASSSSHTAGDRTYRLDLPALTRFEILNDTSFDGVVELFDATCGGVALDCNDTPEDLTFATGLSAGTYYYVVDGWGTTNGTYNITVSGTIAAGGSCESALAQSGALTCPTGSACQGTPGTRTCAPAQCNDGMDNDGDGFTDFPTDPGCASISDADETDACPGGASCPQCGNGIDDDADGTIDYPADVTCTSASGISEQCASSEGIVPLTMPATPGTTVGSVNDVRPSCGVGATHTAPDNTYQLDVPALTSLTLALTNLTPSWDSATVLLDATCGTTPVACSDPSSMTVPGIAAGRYYFVVDGYSSASGAYTLNVSGTIASGASCESALAVSGALTCAADHTCLGTPGTRTCQPSPCADGIDNDGDSLIDYPLDPGCESPSDADETDPAVAPACANGADDDNDTFTDYLADLSCWAASGTSEALCPMETDRARVINTPRTSGTTTNATNNFPSQSCQSNATGEDVVFGLVLPVPVATLTIDASASGFDTILSIRNEVCATELQCDDDDGDGTRSLLELTGVAAGTYAVILDGYSGADGAYTLDVSGTVVAGTACDSPLFASGVLACVAGTSCTAGTCQ